MKATRSQLFLIAAVCSTVLIVIIYSLQFDRNMTSINYFVSPQSYSHTKPKMIENSLHKKQIDTLADLSNFEYLLINETLCMTPETVNQSSIVIMIHTARENFDQRYAIRNTWGSLKALHRWQLHLIFLLGNEFSNQTFYQTELQKESERHGDMIMGNFVDSYKNLTYKHLMGYKWVSTFCPSAKFILKTDDDMFADIFNVVEVVLPVLNNSNKTYACLNMRGNNPIRDTKSKWYIPKELYPDDKYPEFCSGSAYLVKADDAGKIYSVSNKTKFFWVDDVFVTGILREKYNALSKNNHTNDSSLELLSLSGRHHLGDKREIVTWCSEGLESKQLKFTFILLNKVEFVSEMFCIWNKVRLMKYVMDTIIGKEPPVPQTQPNKKL